VQQWETKQDNMNDLRKIVDYKVLEPYKIWLSYDDGVQGKVDLSDFAHKEVFAPWKDESFFRQMKVDRGRRVYWSEDLDFCPDALYIQITGHNPYA
jgi:hypothetical protein